MSRGLARASGLVLGLCLMATTLCAQAPTGSLRPEARPSSALPERVARVQRTEAGVTVTIGAEIRPMPRPGSTEASSGFSVIRPAAAATIVPQTATGLAPGQSLRPEARVIRTAARATAPVQPRQSAPAAQSQPKRTAKAGRICGDRKIRGVDIAAIAGRVPGCGVSDPVRVTSVAGVQLSRASVMDCTTAKALKTWVEDGAKPAVGRRGGGLVGLQVAAHYACRTRNHKPGGRISEHGKGKAIDISGFILKNGETITLTDGWRHRRDGKILKEAHAAACGPFGTVLGPAADRYHQDHFHFDTARYRSGPYCR